jgi:hypothetical protein
MLVISRDGKTTVITGWRAWLLGAGLGIAAAIILVPLAALLLGLTLTIAAFLLFVVPLAVVIAVLTTWLRGLWPR